MVVVFFVVVVEDLKWTFVCCILILWTLACPWPNGAWYGPGKFNNCVGYRLFVCLFVCVFVCFVCLFVCSFITPHEHAQAGGKVIGVGVQYI